MLLVEALLVDEHLVRAVLAAQVALRQGRPLVRPVRLAAEQHDPALEALVAQRLGGLRAREARPHDHERPVVCHRCSFRAVNPGGAVPGRYPLETAPRRRVWERAGTPRRPTAPW